MILFFIFEIIFFVAFFIILIGCVTYGLNDFFISYLLFCGIITLTLMPFAIIYLFEKTKRKKLFQYLKHNAIKIEAQIRKYTYYYLTGHNNRFYHYCIRVKFEYCGRTIYYSVQTNNKQAALYRYNDTLPIYYLPAYCDYLIGEKTQMQLLKELGLKVKVKDQITFPMIVFGNDLQ